MHADIDHRAGAGSQEQGQAASRAARVGSFILVSLYGVGRCFQAALRLKFV
ncbi:hypothetical protein HMPREF9120_02175 [Neisseria sp. oral taxon 020 str. F0370]|nr:hypothetical protein HMPREF9120_02175 [Neisseria sp. oral taxon 020 str. F0370]